MSTSDAKPQPSRRERERAHHREEILATALSLFAAHGFHQTTMQMIAEACEFSVGYLYKHFDGKEAIYHEMTRIHVDAINQIGESARKDSLSPLEEMRVVLQRDAAHFNEHRDFMRIFHRGLVAESAYLADAKRRHRENLAESLDRAIAAGELIETDTELLAAAIFGATGELLRELALRPVEDPFDELPDLVFRLLIDPIRK